MSVRQHNVWFWRERDMSICSVTSRFGLWLRFGLVSVTPATDLECVSSLKPKLAKACQFGAPNLLLMLFSTIQQL